MWFILIGLILLIPFGAAAGDALLGMLHLHPDAQYQPGFLSVLCPGVIALLGGWFVYYGVRAFRHIRHTHSHHNPPAKNLPR